MGISKKIKKTKFKIEKEKRLRFFGGWGGFLGPTLRHISHTNKPIDRPMDRPTDSQTDMLDYKEIALSKRLLKRQIIILYFLIC